LIFKIYWKVTADISKELVSLICKVKAHSSKVIGIGVNYESGYIYSCANDKQVVISEMNYGTVVKGNIVI